MTTTELKEAKDRLKAVHDRNEQIIPAMSLIIQYRLIDQLVTKINPMTGETVKLELSIKAATAEQIAENAALSALPNSVTVPIHKTSGIDAMYAGWAITFNHLKASADEDELDYLASIDDYQAAIVADLEAEKALINVKD